MTPLLTRLTLHERLLSHVAIDSDTDCWLWTAHKTEHGYGQIKVDGRSCRAHRVAYELLVGPIPDGLNLDHLCHSRDAVCGLPTYENKTA